MIQRVMNGSKGNIVTLENSKPAAEILEMYYQVIVTYQFYKESAAYATEIIVE